MERKEIDKILKQKEKLFVETVLNRNLWRNKCIEVQEILDEFDVRDMSIVEGHDLYRKIRRAIK